MSAGRGRFVVLEGGDGVGKTTQLPRLVAALERQGHVVRAIREPGGTAAGDAIRALLLDPATALVPAAELLLFLAARAQVVADRFFVSTYAYQAAGHGLDLSQVRVATALATGGLVPDLTLVLRLDAAAAAARRTARGDADRMERHGAPFAARVAAAYEAALDPAWQARHPECGRLVGIDADAPAEVVTTRLLDAIAGAVGERPAPSATLT